MFLSGSISNEWRSLDQESKNKWNNLALKDKERYQREKASFVGPWKVRTCVRTPKDPNSPKRPVPAYFAFSNERRQEVRDNNPEATSTELSRILSDMWKHAPGEIRKRYLDREFIERRAYNEKTMAWRAKRGAKKPIAREAESQPVPVYQGATEEAKLGSTGYASSPRLIDAIPSRMDPELSIGDDSSTNPGTQTDTQHLRQAGAPSSLGPLCLTSGLLHQQPFGSIIVGNPDQSLLAKLLKRSSPATQLPLEMQNPDRDVLRQLLLQAVSIQTRALGYSQSMPPSPGFPGCNTTETRSRLMQGHVVDTLELLTGTQPTIGGVPSGGHRNPRTLPHASIVIPSDNNISHLHGMAEFVSSQRILVHEAARESTNTLLLSQILGHLQQPQVGRPNTISTTGMFNFRPYTSLQHSSTLHSLLMRLGSSSSGTHNDAANRNVLWR